MAKTVLEVKNLTKKFGDFVAVDDISFSVKAGEIVGLLGPNGAGKTTTIQMLLSVMQATSGEIFYFGKSLAENREVILQQVNYASGYSHMPWRLTVWENLKVYGYLYSLHDHEARIKRLAEIFSATELLQKEFVDLSQGQKTRVFLIRAFLNDPKLVLLDEPTAALDPDIADKIRHYILETRRERQLSLLITSHNMMEVEEMCDRVIFLHRGHIYAIDTPHGLAKRNKLSELQLMIKDGLKRLTEMVNRRKYKYVEKNRFVTITLPEAEIAECLLALGKRGIEYNDIEIVRPSLEDFFISVGKNL